MAWRTTRWEPNDTHPGLLIEYEWDDSLPEDERVHVPIYATLNGNPVDHVEAHDRALRQNQRKNLALAELIESLPAAAVEDEVDPGGKPTGRKRAKPQFEPTWTSEVDAAGSMLIKLNVPNAGLNNGQKTAMRARLNARFGDRVRLDD